MKGLLIAAAAFSALAGAAMAQPAYHPDQGGPPSNYPPCSHRGEDRCMPRGGWGQHGEWRHHHGDWGRHHHHHHMHGHGGHSSTDGERG